MHIQNESPSLFGLALRNLLEEVYEKVRGNYPWKNLTKVWFPNTTVRKIKSWLEERSFPDHQNLDRCITIARIFLDKEDTGISHGIAFAVLDTIHTLPDDQKTEARKELIQYAKNLKEGIPQRQKVAQEFLSVLDLPLRTDREPTNVTKFELRIDGDKCRSIAEYYFRSPDKARDMLSVYNSDLSFPIREYLANRFFWSHHNIGNAMAEIIFPTKKPDEDTSIYNMVVQRKNFSAWTFDHGAEMFELGTELKEFMQREDEAYREKLKIFMETRGKEILLTKVTS